MSRGTSNFSILSRLVVLFLLLLLAATTTIASERNNKISLLLPRDVSFDNAARKALQKIRRQQQQQQDDDRADSAEKELSSSGNRNQVTMTMVGFKGGRIQDQVNQDRSFVMSPFCKENASLLMGVFDGHGNLGEVVAEYALQELPKRLLEKIQSVFQNDFNDTTMDDIVKRALIDTFMEIDESIPTAEKSGGCTASVILQLGSRLYIANAGDSVSLVAVHSPSQNITRVVYITQEDKPHLPEEYNRIVNMGGRVYIPNDPMEDSSSRVMFTDPSTGYQVGLAMSRSLGDRDMVGVIAEPIVHVLDIRELELATTLDDETCTAADDQACITEAQDVNVFCISATDGMMDYVSPQELVKSFAKAFFHQDDGSHPLTVAEDLILTAAKGWNVEMEGEYRDDIAIAASKVVLSVEELDGAAKEEPS